MSQSPAVLKLVVLTRIGWIASFYLVTGAVGPPALAAEEATVTTLVRGLRGPCGIAVRPEGTESQFELYIADSGAGRVARIGSQAPDQIIDVVTGFATAAAADERPLPAGPHGLLFLDRNRLAVTGSDGEGHGFVRLYDLSKEGTLESDQFEQSVSLESGLDATGDASWQMPHGMARTSANDYVSDALIVSTLQQGGRQQLWKLPVRAGSLGPQKALELPAAGQEAKLPGAVAVSERGFVVVSAAGADRPSSGRLVFLNPMDDTVALALASEVGPIVGLAYSPGGGNLYAAVFATGDTSEGGIYRIDAASEPGRPASKAVLVATVRRPTALVFGPDGALYTTALGEAESDEAESAGVVVKIAGEL